MNSSGDTDSSGDKALPGDTVMSADAGRTRPAWLVWLPVAALLIAIASHAIRMETVNADRQGGSAFAMFSSVDFANSRQVTATGTVDGQQFGIRLPADLGDQVWQVRRAPTTDNATELASQIVGGTWSLPDDKLELGGDILLDEVTVTVFGLTADGRVLASQTLATGSASEPSS